jgi:flagellar biosynthetic protein FliP
MRIRIGLGGIGFIIANGLCAEELWPLFSLGTDTANHASQTVSVSVQLMLLLALLTLLPAMLLVTTSFTRVVVVLSILRQAIGLNQTPSNQILVGLSFFLTLYIMSPVFSDINQSAIQPYLAQQLSPEVAAEKALVPLKQFMLTHTRETDLALFQDLSSGKTEHAVITDLATENKEAVSIFVLLPAFVLSELKTAFQIGFLLFVPFLVIDLVVSSVLVSMGMMMLSPLMISLPFKLMIFVVVDGWSLVIGSLASSYQ